MYAIEDYRFTLTDFNVLLVKDVYKNGLKDGVIFYLEALSLLTNSIGYINARMISGMNFLMYRGQRKEALKD